MMRKHLTAALLFLGLTCILTNPLGLHVWNAVEDKQDGLLNTWIVAWVGHALVTDPIHLYNTNIFYPYTNTLAYSEILLPPSLLALPLTLATNNPIFGYNLALLAMLWLNAFGMYLFLFDLTRRTGAGWIAGAIYAFNPFNLGNFAQMQLLTLGFLPLALLSLNKLVGAQMERGEERGERYGEQGERYGERSVRGRGRSVLYGLMFALFFVLQSLASFYYALLAGFAVGLFLLWWLITRRADAVKAARQVIVPLGASFALIALVLIPFLLPYFEVQRELGFSRRVEESEPFSAALKQFTEVSPNNVLYGRVLAPNPVKRVGGYPLDNLFPGIAAIVLAVIGVIGSQRRPKSFFVLLLAVAFLLALGPRLYLTSTQATDVLMPYRWLYEFFPPLRALRAPVRFDALVNLALAGLAGLGTAALLTRVEGAPGGRMFRWGGRAAAGYIPAALVALIALEYLALPAANIVTLPVADEIPDVYKWLAGQPHGVVLELPMMGPNAQKELDISTQYLSTYHWQNTPDGYSGFIPPRRGEVAFEMLSFPSPRSLALARALNVQFVILHEGDCADPLAVKGCIVPLEPQPRVTPELDKSLYVPSQVAAGAPFSASLVLINRSAVPYALQPTDQERVEAVWGDGRRERISLGIPLVTSSVSVVAIPLQAPREPGEHSVQLLAHDAVIGETDVTAVVHVGSELAREVVLPAGVELVEPLGEAYAAGDAIRVSLRWKPYNKVNAYYSASVRLVNAQGVKVANTDRQPVVETFLWKPEEPVADTFILEIPPNTPAGVYRVEVMMYQADTDVTAFLLDDDLSPRQHIVLGEIRVK